MSIPKKFQRKWSKEEVKRRAGKRGGTLAIQDIYKFNTKFPHEELWENLTDEEVQLYKQNPHNRQVFATFRPVFVLNRSLQAEDRYINSNTPSLPYQRRRHEWKTVDHWGQRKLLFSEIEFLTNYSSPGDTVVYAGAAPGDHTNFLSDLFPEIKFILVDPADFTCLPTDRIEIIQDFFDDELATQLSETSTGNLLFISDVRSWGPGMSDEMKEKRVQIDMQMQENWTVIMKPKASMFKFRLPYTSGETEYFDGKIYLPVWGGRTTSESRLVVDDSSSFKYKSYDHTTYEDLLFAFNTQTRTSFFDIDQEYIDLDIGYDRCFDCASEIYILEEYVKTLDEDETMSLPKKVSKLASRIDKQCSKRGRTLKHD